MATQIIKTKGLTYKCFGRYGLGHQLGLINIGITCSLELSEYINRLSLNGFLRYLTEFGPSSSSTSMTEPSLRKAILGSFDRYASPIDFGLTYLCSDFACPCFIHGFVFSIVFLLSLDHSCRSSLWITGTRPDVIGERLSYLSNSPSIIRVCILLSVPKFTQSIGRELCYEDDMEYLRDHQNKMPSSSG